MINFKVGDEVEILYDDDSFKGRITLVYEKPENYYPRKLRIKWRDGIEYSGYTFEEINNNIQMGRWKYYPREDEEYNALFI